MVRYFCIISIFVFSAIPLFAQEKDPEATALLKKIEKNFPPERPLESEFTFTIKYPQEEVIVQKGKMIQKGAGYFVETDDFIFQSDGKAAYLVNKKSKEAYINSLNQEGELSSPADIISFYKKGDYSYILVPEQQEYPKLTLIEFKPEDRNSPYFKVKMFVEESEARPAVIQLFEKDGSRYILEIDRLGVASAIDSKNFVFDKAKYAGFLIEDLRID